MTPFIHRKPALLKALHMNPELLHRASCNAHGHNTATTGLITGSSATEWYQWVLPPATLNPRHTDQFGISAEIRANTAPDSIRQTQTWLQVNASVAFCQYKFNKVIDFLSEFIACFDRHKTKLNKRTIVIWHNKQTWFRLYFSNGMLYFFSGIPNWFHVIFTLLKAKILTVMLLS